MDKQRSVIFYGAITVDGYLAWENHSLDWLFGTEGEDESSYPEFSKTIDTQIMSRETYEQVLLLSPEGFPDGGMKRYVFSHTRTDPVAPVEFVQGDIPAFVRKLK